MITLTSKLAQTELAAIEREKAHRATQGRRFQSRVIVKQRGSVALTAEELTLLSRVKQDTAAMETEWRLYNRRP